MNRFIHKIGRAALFAAVICLFAVSAEAQVGTTSNIAQVGLSMTVTSSVSISVNPAAISFTYVPGTGTNGAGGSAVASGPIQATIAWNLTPTSGLLQYDAYFTSANALTDGGSNVVPASDVFMSVAGGSPEPFSSTSLFGSNSAPLYEWSTSSNPTGGNSSSILLSMAGLPALSPSSLTGTLNFEAQTH